MAVANMMRRARAVTENPPSCGYDTLAGTRLVRSRGGAGSGSAKDAGGVSALEECYGRGHRDEAPLFRPVGSSPRDSGLLVAPGGRGRSGPDRVGGQHLPGGAERTVRERDLVDRRWGRGGD